MVDLGAALNLLSSRLVQDLKLPTIKSPQPIKILTYQSRHHEFVDTMIRVPFSMHGVPFLTSCYVIKNGITNVLLGKPWMCIHDVIYGTKINALLVEHCHGS